MNKLKLQIILAYALIYGTAAFIASLATLLILNDGRMRMLFGPDISLVYLAALIAVVLGPLSLLVRRNKATLLGDAAAGIGVALATYTCDILFMHLSAGSGGLFDIFYELFLIGLIVAGGPILVFGSLAGIFAERARRWLLAHDDATRGRNAP